MASASPHRLRFGVQLQAQRTSWPDYLAAVRAVEELGFDTVWNFDHLLPFAGPDDIPCFETWTTLTAMAACTSRIRIGALVNGVLYRDPATLAKSAAMVDQISGGRLEFSLGAAWAEREFRTYGLPFPSLTERLGRLDEALQIVTSLWTQPRTTFNGTYYTVNNAPCEPKPLQQPLPIVVGGRGRGTLRIVAKYATEWNCIGTPEFCAERRKIVHEACAAIGRDPNEIIYSTHPQLAIAPTHDAAEAKARAVTQIYGNDFEAERENWVLGTPAEVRAQIQRYIDVGITHWIFAQGSPFDLDGLRLFAEEVIPAFR